MNYIKYLKAISLSLFFAFAGCQSYLERNDGVTSSAGDAQAINEAKLVVDPWPEHADNNHIHSDGQRLSGAVKRYKTQNPGDEVLGSPGTTN